MNTCQGCVFSDEDYVFSLLVWIAQRKLVRSTFSFPTCSCWTFVYIAQNVIVHPSKFWSIATVWWSSTRIILKIISVNLHKTFLFLRLATKYLRVFCSWYFFCDQLEFFRTRGPSRKMTPSQIFPSLSNGVQHCPLLVVISFVYNILI